jgi:hypothetical protein
MARSEYNSDWHRSDTSRRQYPRLPVANGEHVPGPFFDCREVDLTQRLLITNKIVVSMFHGMIKSWKLIAFCNPLNRTIINPLCQ